MQLSNRLTFSLASLIFLIALGLVFAPMSVLAHPDATGEASTPRPHSHPLLEDLLLKATPTDATDLGTAVARHGIHPVPTITLKANPAQVQGNKVLITTTEKQFTVIITFDRDVSSDETHTAATADTTNFLDTNKSKLFKYLFLDKNGTPIEPVLTLTVVSTARVGTGANLSTTEFTAVVEVATGAIPTGTEDMETLTLRLVVSDDDIDTTSSGHQGLVYGFQKSEIWPDGITTSTVTGGYNVASAVAEFTLVQALTPAPKPMANVTVADDTYHGGGRFEVNFTFAAAQATFVEGDIDTSDNARVLPGSLKQSTTDPKVWTAIIESLLPTETGDITVTIAANSANAQPAAGDAGSVTVKVIPPAPAPPNLTATAGIGSVTLTWDPIAGSTYEYKMGTGAYMDVAAADAGNLKVSNLTPGTEVEFSVRVKAAPPVPVGTAASVKATPTAPATPAPPNLTATAGIGSVTLTWDPIAGSTYEYKMGTGAYMDVAAADAGNLKVSNLTPGTEVEFSVRVKAAPPVPVGTAASVKATPTAPVITQPTNVTATLDDDSNVLVKWKWMGANATETAALDGFLITWNPSQKVAATKRSFTIDASLLTTGTPINVSVQALATADSDFNTPQTGTGTPAPTPVTPNMLRFPLGTTIPNQTFTAGTQITAVPLPKALGGSKPYTYTLHKGSGQVDVTSGDNGLMVDLVNLQLMGTPTAAALSTDYIWRVSDSNATTQPVDLAFRITVNSSQMPASPPDSVAFTVATAAGKTTVTITETTRLPNNGFSVLRSYNPALPNIKRFFAEGGTISVLGPSGAKQYDVVIDEIMWGLDLNAIGTDRSKHQFIELYDTTGSGADLTQIEIVFDSARTVPEVPANKVLLDQISNVSGVGWVITDAPGSDGRIPTAGNAGSENLVSMYRKIDYVKVEKTHNASDTADNRKKQLDGFPNGNALGSWAASNAVDTYGINLIGSPGSKPFKAYEPPKKSTFVDKPLRINEIGNDTGSENDWVELYNDSDSAVSLKNYALSQVTAKGTDTKLFDFKDQDWYLPKRSFLVVSTRHPRDTDLATGKDLALLEDRDTVDGKPDSELDEENDRTHAGAKHFFVVKPVNLADSGKTLLILRNAHDKQKSDSNLVDVVGTGKFDDPSIGTNVWPLKATGAPSGETVKGGDQDFRAGKVYKRNGGTGRDKENFEVVGYTGVGYDRIAAATAANGGTPGYDNGAVKEKIADLSNAKVTFSEIMLGLGEGRQNLPQWIELYNSSMIQAVNLNGWKLHVENTTDVKTALDAVLTLDGIMIQPNQTVLIVTNTGRVSDPDHFPSNRVVNLWTTKKHRDALEMVRRTDQVFSTTGLYLKLTDKDGKHVDEIGNLDGNRRTRDELMDTWTIPMDGEDDGRRSSLIRVYDDGVAIDGTLEEAWVLADETNLAYAISETYYGDPDDYGTPGFRGGGPLPVSLSKFRPERLKDTGEIVIRWVTESELNNAGFNILRSETRTGAYTQLNTQLIKGQGTTSERTSYEWKDTTAKPNVVYYYQIQDVSLDGQVQTLRQSRLKGNVTAAGKLTTTWGELKSQD